MPNYRCLIRGEHFPGHLFDRDGTIGFYTTRFVQAPSPAAAEQAAVDVLRTDPKLTLSPDKPKPVNAKVFVEEIVADSYRRQVGAGFCFFAEDDNEAAAAALLLERDANWPDQHE